MEERAPLDRQSLQHTSKDLEGQIWAQIGTPQYNPPVAPAQASEASTITNVNVTCTSPLESYKIPKLGSSTKAEETAKSSSAGGDSRDDDSDAELHVDENAETVLVEAEPEHSESKETEEKPASKGEEEKSDKKEKESSDKGKESAGDSYIDDIPYTSSNDPKLIKARVFVGQLNTSKCTKKDVEKVFAPYGKLLGVLLLHGYGFVQYEDEECAKKAIKEAHGAEICGSKIACDRPMALKQLLRSKSAADGIFGWLLITFYIFSDERRRRSASPESKRRRERELLEELEYLRRRAQLDELDQYYYRDRFPDYPTRPPFRDPHFDPPFERSLPPPPPMDRYERMHMEELEMSRARERYPSPPPPRPGLYDRPRDDPFDDRRPFHRDPFDHFDMPPPHRRY
jgi:RNA recognition motif-containing protein